ESFGYVDLSAFCFEFHETIRQDFERSPQELSLSRFSKALWDKDLDDILDRDLREPRSDGEQVHFSYCRNLDPGLRCQGSDCISACRLTRNELLIDLARPQGSGVEVEGVDVAFELDDESFERLRRRLMWLFRDRPDVLRVS